MPIDRTSHLIAAEPVRNGRRRSFYRTFVQFLCSNVGLVIIVVAYSIGGAFLFILLEQYVELQQCQQGNLLENVSISNISESMYNYVVLSPAGTNISLIQEEILSYLINFTDDVYDRRSDYRYTGQDCETYTGWTFPAALLFTITTITSIGYGFVTPISWEGQITCICYALIGIPVFLLFLTSISSILGDMFRFLYSTFLHSVCCCCRIYARTHRRHISSRRSIKRHGIQYVGTTSVDPTWPETYPEKFVEETADHEDANDLDDDIEDEINDVFVRMESRVPILAVISIIIAYICLGAIMFKQTEGWLMSESVYFCYITLSTLGFGDYVPGITSSGTNGLRFLGTCVYIVLGLAILAMCFDLIKESIVDKFIWLGDRLGVVSEDAEYDDDPIHYADFQYTRPQDLQEFKHTPLKCRRSDSPPAYDYGSAEEQWAKDIKDKAESASRFTTSKPTFQRR